MDRIRRALPAVGERAAKTFAQTLLAVIATMGAVSLSDVNWWEALSAALLAAILSTMTSVASWRLGKEPGPSLSDESVQQPQQEAITHV
jgi:divalent metal cation (Fe/Co/Zn/Cd) transporter